MKLSTEYKVLIMREVNKMFLNNIKMGNTSSCQNTEQLQTHKGALLATASMMMVGSFAHPLGSNTAF